MVQQQAQTIFEKKGYAAAVCFLLSKGYSILQAEKSINTLRDEKIKLKEVTMSA